MSGTTARRGFQYQDYLLIERVTSFLLEKRCAEITGQSPPSDLIFYAEAPAPGTAGDAESPDWDLQVENPADGTLLLEEVKSGALEADDRSTLWRRIRRSLNKMPQPHSRVQVRLTINPDRPPDNLDRWRLLATTSQRVAITRPHRVTSADELASEALFYLTDSSEGGRSLTIADARNLLSTFELHEATRETLLQFSIRDKLRMLTTEELADSVCDAIYGYVVKKAASLDPNERMFAASALGTQVALLQRLLAIDPPKLQLWRSLHQRAFAHRTQRPSSSQAGLPYQDWRRVQPAAAEALAISPEGSFALTGRGGSGKTVLLEYVQREENPDTVDALNFSGTDWRGLIAADVADSLGLGVFLAAAKKRRLHLYVDGLEGAADSYEQLGSFAAALARIAADPNASVRLTCRTTAWNHVSSTACATAFHVLELREWDETDIRRLIGASHRPELGNDLIKLLRTPLLLDLFLRTFGLDQPIPAGLHSRHAVLAAYWKRRILPPGHSIAPIRRAILDRMAIEEGNGIRAHQSTEVAAAELESEGLLTSRSGLYQFRHPLLRDFSVAQYVLTRHKDATQVAAALSAISDLLVRSGGVRATIEAIATDPYLSHASDSVVLHLGPMLQAMAQARCVDELSDVLGEMDDIADTFQISDILLAFNASPDRSVPSRTLAIARAAINEQWLRILLNIPDSNTWAERQVWMGINFLWEIRQLVDACLRTNPRPDQGGARIFQGVAVRLREWSSAPKLQGELAQNGGSTIGAIADTVAQLDPTPATLDWLSSVVRIGNQAAWWVLHALPIMAARAKTKGISLNAPMLSHLYIEAAGFKREEHSLSGQVLAKDMDFTRINLALLGDSLQDEGLINSDPGVFVPIALDILSGLAKPEVERRKQQIAELMEKAQETADQMLQTQIANFKAEYRQASASIVRRMPDGQNSRLNDDILDGRYWEHRSPRDRVINHLRSMIREHLTTEDTFLPTIFWPAVKSTFSAVGRILILHELLKAEPPKYLEIIDEIIQDERLYFFPEANVYLAVALQRCWPLLSTGTRNRLLEIIINAERPHRVEPVLIRAQLLIAIPHQDVPPSFAPLLAALASQGWESPVLPSEEEDTSVTFGPLRDDLLDQHLPAPAELSDNCKANWRRLRQLTNNIQTADEALFSQIVVAFRRILNCLPSKRDLETSIWTISSLSMILREVAERNSQQKLSGSNNLSQEEASSLLRWSMELAQSRPRDSWKSNGELVKFSDVIHGITNLWGELMNIANLAACFVDKQTRESALQEYFREIERVRASLPGENIRDLLFYTVPSHWLVPGAGGGKLLLELMMTIKDGGILRWALNCLPLLNADAEKVLRHWLLDADALVPGEQSFKFVGEVGIFLGYRCLRRDNDEKSFWQRIVDELLITLPQVGALSDQRNYRSWVFGVIFGAKQSISHSKGSRVFLQDYVNLMESAWDRVRIGRQEGHRPQRFSLFAFYPLLNAASQTAQLPMEHAVVVRRQQWWGALEPLIRRVLREGPCDTVHDILFALRDPNELVGSTPAQQMNLVEEIADRVSREGSDLISRNDRSERDNWSEALRYGCSFLRNVALAAHATAAMKSRVYEILKSWEDLGLPDAMEAARAVRVQPADT